MQMTSAETVLARYEEYVAAFEGDIGRGTGRNWTPYRFCSEDWLLAVCVVRTTRQRYEIALFGCEDHADFEPDAGLKAALSFILADAFHKTGRMELHFCGPRKGQDPAMECGYCFGIPRQIEALAASLGIELPRSRIISDTLGQSLYRKMVGLSDELAQKLREQDVDPTRTAFLLHRGVLSGEGLNFLVSYSQALRAVLEGRLIPENWLTFKRELLIMRRMLLTERVRAVIEQGLSEERSGITVQWLTGGWIEIKAESEFSLSAMWDERLTLRANTALRVLLLPLDRDELTAFSWDGVAPDASSPRLIAVPRDLLWLNSANLKRWQVEAKERGLRVVVLHETLDELDSEVLLRLQRFASTRMMIEEQRE